MSSFRQWWGRQRDSRAFARREALERVYSDQCRDNELAPSAWINYGEFLASRGDRVEAAQALLRAAELFTDKGCSEDAARVYARIHQVDPQNPGIYAVALQPANIATPDGFADGTGVHNRDQLLPAETTPHERDQSLWTQVAALLPPLPAHVRYSLQSRSRVVCPSAGQTIVTIDQPAAHVFVVVEGSVLVTHGPTRELRHAGDWFGEESLLAGTHRHAPASADTDAIVAAVPANLLRVLSLGHPSLREYLLRSMVRQAIQCQGADRQELGLDCNLFNEFFSSLRLLELNAGDIAVHEGRHSAGIYLLVNGELVVSSSRQSPLVPRQRLHRGAIFGASCLMYGRPATATISAPQGAWITLLPRKMARKRLLAH